MLKDKRVVYGILAGAAVLVGAAVASHYFSKAGDDDKLEQEIEKLGSLQRDNSNHIEFDQFIKIFEISSQHAKTEFSEKKKSYI